MNRFNADALCRAILDICYLHLKYKGIDYNFAGSEWFGVYARAYGITIRPYQTTTEPNYIIYNPDTKSSPIFHTRDRCVFFQAIEKDEFFQKYD